MKRRFSKKQREALALSSIGLCSICGKRLPESWHADHVKPFSKNGATDVINGQALCPSCNLKKGNKMNRIVLRDWQNKSLPAAVDHFEKPEKLFLTHATPGAGKTVHALSVAQEMMLRGVITHIVVLAPSTVLVKQWQSDANGLYGVELKNSMLYNQMPDFHEYKGIVMTYQGMNECHEALRIFCANNKTLVIADEIHHVADGQSWGSAFRNAFDPGKNILALTGTPWTSNGKPIPFVKYGSDGYCKPDFSYDKQTAIRDSVCRSTGFNRVEATDLVFDIDGEVVEYHTLKEAIGDEIQGAYRKTVQSLKHMKTMFSAADEQITQLRTSGIPDAAGLVVATDIKTAHAFQDEIFMLTGVEYPIVHSLADSPHKKIEEFKSTNERWLISVDMVTEGVDIKRLQVCVFLSTKNTELFMRQVIGRIERIRSNSYADRYSYFYHTDIDQLNEIVDRFIEENNIGEALRDEAAPKSSGDREGAEDNVTLIDIKSKQAGLVAEGHFYDDGVVSEAIHRKRKTTLLDDVPLFVVCKMVMAEREAAQVKSEASTGYKPNVPLTDKKDRLRSRIAKEVNRMLWRTYSRKPSGEEIKDAHKRINRAVGIKNTNDSVSLGMFEKKLEYIRRES